MRQFLLYVICMVTTLPSAVGAEIAPYQDATLSHEERARDLVDRMTIKEKISQMVNAANGIPRLGVPEYNWWNEALHGLARAGKATTFPQAIGLGATFDPALIEEVASAIADEARAFYVAATSRGNRRIYTGLSFYSPNVNIYRDPRWGRGQETYGEDPYLTSQIGLAFVKGLQGDDPHYMKAAACAKHFAVHSGPEALRHSFDAVVSPRDLYETYLPAFKVLVKEGGVASVMSAYNRVNGEAASASPFLLQQTLREEWGFKGFVTSDCGALRDIFKYHKLVETGEEAAAMAANSGLNLNCGSIYSNRLLSAVKQGLVSEATIDTLLCELMEVRFKLGLFDEVDKVPYNLVDRDVVDSPRHKDLAYRSALKSIVMLENKGGVLPLKGDENYIFVTGPTANNPDALIGNYYGVSDRYTTFAEGIAGAVARGVSVEYRQGVMIDRENVNPLDWASGEASKADAVVVCLGLTSLLEGEEGESIASDQRGDMVRNALPESQIKYLRKVRAKIKGKTPLITVVAAGSPVELDEVQELSDALLYVWYPGEAGGDAVADIIMGKESPSGRTPMTFVKDVKRLPPFEEYSMKGRTYRYMSDEDNILYPFGYGLSYAKFEYSDLRMPKQLRAGGELEVSVVVTNTSDRRAEEVVQLYVSDQKASVDVALRQLATFARVELDAGESKRVELRVRPDKFSIITDDSRRVVEGGLFTISVGGGQPTDPNSGAIIRELIVRGNIEIDR